MPYKNALRFGVALLRTTKFAVVIARTNFIETNFIKKYPMPSRAMTVRMLCLGKLHCTDGYIQALHL